MTHYLNFIDEDEDDIEEEVEEEVEEVEEEEDDEEDDEVIIKINKRLIPRNYTFYKIRKNECENYVGSTVNYKARKQLHKNCCNDGKSKAYNLPVYKYIRENGGYNSFDYEILDTKFVCKKDAEIYEAELMRLHKSTLNVVRNYTEEDIKEYKKKYEKNEKCKEYRKEYRKSRKEYQKEYNKKYYEKKKNKQIHLTINLNINLPQD